MLNRFHAAAFSAALVAAALASGTRAADEFPTRAVTIIVAQPPGGGTDIISRIIAEQLQKQLGQPFVVANRPGAGTVVGTAAAANAAPDGYTLLAGSMGSHVAAPVFTPNVRYDSQRDFAAIGITAHAPAVIVARKDFPAKDLTEFIAYLKAHGDTIKQAHGGIGSSSHMACLLFTAQAGVKPILVGYRGTGPAMNDLVGGHVDFFCEQAVSVTGQINSGAVKAYAISAEERLATLPAVPTARELGIDFRMSVWSGIFAPKGVPQEIIDKLSQALDKTLDDPGVQKRLAELGGAIPAKDERTPAKFESFVAAEIARWSPILKAASEATAN